MANDTFNISLGGHDPRVSEILERLDRIDAYLKKQLGGAASVPEQQNIAKEITKDGTALDDIHHTLQDLGKRSS